MTPNNPLTRLGGGVFAVDLSSWSPAPAWPTNAGLIKSMAGPVGSCLITVLPHGDLTQASAELVRHFRPREEESTVKPMLAGAAEFVIGVDTHRDSHPASMRPASKCGP